MSARDALREVLTGAAIRAIAGIRDAGEAFLARVAAPDGGDPVDVDTSDAAPDGRDVWVRVEDELTGAPSTGRLHVPGNILFALPESGETVMVVRGRDTGGPGAGYVFLGDAGRALPPWLRSAVGLFTAKLLRLESSASRVELVAQDGAADVVLNKGTLRVARVTDRVVVGTLSGVAGPYPVNFIFTPQQADGTPGAPTALGTTVTLGAFVADLPGNGAPHVKG